MLRCRSHAPTPAPRHARRRYEGIAKLTERVYGSPNGRTTGEWMLINKAAAPIAFPALIGTANRIVNQRNASKEAAPAAASTQPVAQAQAPPPEPDLSPETEKPVSEVVRRLTGQMASEKPAVTPVATRPAEVVRRLTNQVSGVEKKVKPAVDPVAAPRQEQ